jgi:hypothetical protein
MTLDLLTEEQWLNFWANYKGLPGQKKGVLQLRKDMMGAKAGLLGADNEWIKEYRNNPEKGSVEHEGMLLARPVPYFRQTDSRFGTRIANGMCFSSTMAMFVNAFRPGMFKLPGGDDEYLKMLNSHGGDTTEAHDHVEQLARLGIKTDFIDDCGWDDLEAELKKGNPVATGWYHNGPAARPKRDSGHWSLVIGINATHVLMNDPNGEANLVSGGYLANLDGEKLLYSRKNWGPRFMADGKNTGWAIVYKGG